MDTSGRRPQRTAIRPSRWRAAQPAPPPILSWHLAAPLQHQLPESLPAGPTERPPALPRHPNPLPLPDFCPPGQAVHGCAQTLVRLDLGSLVCGGSSACRQSGMGMEQGTRWHSGASGWVAAGHTSVPVVSIAPGSQIVWAKPGPGSYLRREAPRSCPGVAAPWAARRSRLCLGCWHVLSCKERQPSLSLQCAPIQVPGLPRPSPLTCRLDGCRPRGWGAGQS